MPLTTHLSRHTVQRLIQMKKLLQRHGVALSLTTSDVLARALDASEDLDDPEVQACRMQLLRAVQRGQVYLVREVQGAVPCARCGTFVTVRLDVQGSVEQPQQVACHCGQRFAVAFEPRRSPRASCRCPGFYYQKHAQGTRGAIVVENISAQGIGFTVTAKTHTLVSGDTLLLLFRLDDDDATIVTELVCVQHTEGKRVGAAFVTSRHSR